MCFEKIGGGQNTHVAMNHEQMIIVHLPVQTFSELPARLQLQNCRSNVIHQHMHTKTILGYPRPIFRRVRDFYADVVSRASDACHGHLTVVKRDGGLSLS